MMTFNELPDKIKAHLQGITASSGLPEGEESLGIIFSNWLEKKKLFEEQIKILEMVEAEEFSAEETRGVLLLTYSGSLISMGPGTGTPGGGRTMEYASIKLRGDVPDLVTAENIQVAGDIKIDNCAEFEESPLKKSSEIFKIAYCSSDVPVAEQEKRIKEATIFLTNGFVKINRTLSIHKGDSGYQQFNMKSIVGYIAKKNKVTRAVASRIVNDYLFMLETGILLGEKPPLGRLGKISLKIRPAQKARIGRNPATGEEMTIKAKPETPVPRVSFSKYIKDRAAALDVTELGKDSAE